MLPVEPNGLAFEDELPSRRSSIVNALRVDARVAGDRVDGENVAEIGRVGARATDLGALAVAVGICDNVLRTGGMRWWNPGRC